MIMFTAGSACLVYSRFGQILYDYAVALMLLGFGITLCSQLLTFLLIKLLGRRSIIIFMMVALMVRKRGLRDSRASLLQQYIKGQYRARLGQGREGRRGAPGQAQHHCLYTVTVTVFGTASVYDGGPHGEKGLLLATEL